MSPELERILFLVSAHNGLSQRAWVALTELGHDVAVAVVDSDAEMEAAVADAPTGADRVPVLEADDSGVDLVAVSVPDRPPGAGRRPWTVVAGLGD